MSIGFLWLAGLSITPPSGKQWHKMKQLWMRKVHANHSKIPDQTTLPLKMVTYCGKRRDSSAREHM